MKQSPKQVGIRYIIHQHSTKEIRVFPYLLGDQNSEDVMDCIDIIKNMKAI
jgi:hypothetical protein